MFDPRHPFAMPSDPHAFEHLCGVIRPPGWQRIAATLPTLVQAGPNLTVDPTKTVLLYKCFKEVFSGYPDYPAQQIGDCVSFGHGHGNDALMVVEAYLSDLPVESIRRTCTEFLYGEARKVSGRPRPVRRQLRRRGHQGDDDRRHGELRPARRGQRADDLCRLAGQAVGRTGPPSAVEALATPYKLGAGALLTNTDDMIAAIQSGHPCTICTAYGFVMTRDSRRLLCAPGPMGPLHARHGLSRRQAGLLDRPELGPRSAERPAGIGSADLELLVHRG